MESPDSLARELERLDREKSELIQILAHELFTPITTIQGVVLTLSKHGDRLAPADIRELAAGVERASSRLRRLVGNLSAAARLDREDAVTATWPVQVGDVLSRGVAEFEAVPEHVRMPVENDLLDREIWADPDLASRAVAIVLENAVAFSDVEPVEIEVEVHEPELWILVHDRGPGIPDAQRERIFEAFTQTDSTTSRLHQGLGIGLHLARRIMRAHRGDVRAEAREGGGTTVVLSYPLVAEAAET